MTTKWNQIRLLVLAALLMPSAYMVGKNLGYREGIAAQIGGPGSFRTALVEWRDMHSRKVVLYFNDGANGYSTFLELRPEYRHYTFGAKVFTGDNTTKEGIKNCLDSARQFCDNDPDFGDTRVSQGDRYRAYSTDETTATVEAFDCVRDLVEKARGEEYQELLQLREDTEKMARKIERLERQIDANKTN